MMVLVRAGARRAGRVPLERVRQSLIVTSLPFYFQNSAENLRCFFHPAPLG